MPIHPARLPQMSSSPTNEQRVDTMPELEAQLEEDVAVLDPASLRAPGANDATPLTAATDSLPVFFTVDELAHLLRLNRKTLYEALARGDIPGARRIGGTYRIFRDAVLAWFARQDRVSRSRSKR